MPAIFLLLLLPFFSHSQVKKNIPSSTKIYDEAGNLQMIISYSPSCECRTYTEFYTDGKIFAKRVFKVAERKEFIDGEDINYYHDGSIKDYRLWKNALPVKAYSNHDNGKLEHEEFYDGKYKSGTWRYYDYKGDLVKEVIYQPGKTLWDSKKDFATVKKYANGKLVSSSAMRDGMLPVSKKDNVKPVALNEIRDGKALFALRCTACHAADKDGFGPALKGIAHKRSNNWLSRMISDGAQLLAEGDPDAILLYKKWGRKHKPERLDEGQVQALIDYLKTMK